VQACSCLLDLQISFTPAPAQRTQSRKQAIHKLLAKMFTLAGKTRVPHFLEHLVGINENSNKSMVSRYGLPTHAREFQSPAKQINTAPHEHKKKLDSNLSEHFMCAACLSPVCWFSAASCLPGLLPWSAPLGLQRIVAGLAKSRRCLPSAVAAAGTAYCSCGVH